MTDSNGQDDKGKIVEMFCSFALHIRSDTMPWASKKLLDGINKSLVEMKYPMDKVMQKKMFQRKAMGRCFLTTIRTKVIIDRVVTIQAVMIHTLGSFVFETFCAAKLYIIDSVPNIECSLKNSRTNLLFKHGILILAV